MGTVEGLTKARMLEIEASSVITGTVDEDGNLLLETHGGTEINAGYVRGPEGPEGPPGTGGGGGSGNLIPDEDGVYERPEVDTPCLFLGPSNALPYMLDGDTWTLTEDLGDAFSVVWQTSGNGNASWTPDASVQVGDLAVAMYTSGSAAVFTPGSDWNLVTDDAYTGVYGTRMTVWSKILTSTAADSILTSESAHDSWIVSYLRGTSGLNTATRTRTVLSSGNNYTLPASTERLNISFTAAASTAPSTSTYPLDWTYARAAYQSYFLGSMAFNGPHPDQLGNVGPAAASILSVAYGLITTAFLAGTYVLTDGVLKNIGGEKGSAGAGVAEGGAARSVLVKKSTTDYDTKWQPVVAGAIPTTGTWAAGDYLLSTNPASGILGWVCTVAGTPGTWIADTPGGDVSALSGLSLLDLNGSNVNNWSSTWTAQRWDYRRGSDASPVAGGGPGIKISQTEMVTDLTAQMGGSQGQNQANAAMHVAARGLDGSKSQTNAILATASGNPADGSDVCALASWTRVRGGTGTAFGAYLEGRRDVSTASAIGAEIGIRDFSSADGVIDVEGGSDTIGIWISTVGSISGQKAAAGVALGAGNGAQWKIGFHCGQGKIANQAFRDESGSEVSFMSRGSHSTGLEMTTGVYSDAAIKLPEGTDEKSGIKFGTDTALYRKAAGRLQVSGRIESVTPDWVTPTLGNSWVIVDSARTPKFKLLPDATVMMRGMMKLGSASTTVGAFTLPSGYLPQCDESFIVASDAGMARIVIKTTGEVIVWSYAAGGTNAFVSLSGIRFSTI